jgi:hypothetical protein
MNDYTADVLKSRWQRIGRLAAGIAPRTLPVEPTVEDVMALKEDLELFAKEADALILAYGDHLKDHFSMADLEEFEDQVIGALDGNAFYEFEQAVEELQEAAWEAA